MLNSVAIVANITVVTITVSVITTNVDTLSQWLSAA